MGRQESIEDILAQLKGEHRQPPKALPSETKANDSPKVPAPVSLDALLADLNLATPQNHSPLEALLQRVKQGEFTPSPFTVQIATQASSQFHTSPIAYELQQVSAEIEKQHQEQKLAQQRQQAQLATEWLEKLDWLSGEGIWFEKFARNYGSHLEAAIAYLFS
jgi:hypothetical protein